MRGTADDGRGKACPEFTSGVDGASCFIRFEGSIDSYILPEKFTNPFDYEPDPLCLLAVEELQKYITKIQGDWEHNFGFDSQKSGIAIGKMFGVLIVQNHLDELGYLMAFSGKLSGKNDTSKFVPSIFDLSDDDNFLTKGMLELDAMSAEIAALESTPELLERAAMIEKKRQQKAIDLKQQKAALRIAKTTRKERLENAKTTLEPKLFNAFAKALKKENQKEEFLLKKTADRWDTQIRDLENAPSEFSDQIAFLKTARKNKSVGLQEKLFASYQFSNQKGVVKDLKEIFTETIPSAGAGECAAPKLLQYAFENQLKPITMAEFWWGKSTKSEGMQHGHFYPACQEKCVPILGFMLEGMEQLRKQKRH